MAKLPIHIRPFESANQEETRDLVLSGLGEHFDSIDPTINPDLDDIAANYTAAGHEFVVAELDGLIVGAGGLLILSPVTGRIVRVSVNKKRRGCGIGQAIVYHLIQLALSRELQQIHVETNLDWYGAIAFYRRCGFVEYARDKESVHFQISLLPLES